MYLDGWLAAVGNFTNCLFFIVGYIWLLVAFSPLFPHTRDERDRQIHTHTYRGGGGEELVISISPGRPLLLLFKGCV
jgi:hypothetical protein